jgi:putative hydrolase of the HAD superfamily
MSRTHAVDWIALDADDTLWHNERNFTAVQGRFRELLRPYHSDAWIDERLYATEMRNLAHFGYGVKGFTLSMIETAVELSEGRITGREIAVLLDLGKEMLATPVEVLAGVEEAVKELAADGYALMVITKGDLFDQETKVARSGLGPLFRHVEVVSEKREADYTRILERYNIAPERFLMVGNSVKSDILPVLAIGARAVHIPYEITWAHEHVAEEVRHERFARLDAISGLPGYVRSLGG